MFDGIRSKLDKILDCCDNMSCDNIPEKLAEIRTAIAMAKLELEELEFQAKRRGLRKMKKEIPYYVEYVDSNGIAHYAVHFYNRITGFVTMMRDHVFEMA